ncbi:MAG: hypothetical protein ACREDM_11705 [Methylocella sp.]
MSSRPRITGRRTSLAAAFVHAIIPMRVNVAAQANLFKQVGINDNECVYCGDRATDKDYLWAIVKNGRPSGHYHTIDDLVPSCGPCNQSKGGQNWQSWMRGTANGSPTTRNVPDIHERIERLVRFEQEAGKIVGEYQTERRDAVAPKLWDRYWQRLEDIKTLMAEADKDAAEIRVQLEAPLRNGAGQDSN